MIRPHYVPLYQSVCHSEKLADLPDHGARLFYVLLLTHCDSWGRCTARARVLHAKVWAMLGKVSDVEKYLPMLAKVGLIVLYDSNGEPALAIPDWEEKAGKVGRPDRRGDSAFTIPPAGVVPQDSTCCGSSPASRARLDPILSEPIRSDPIREAEPSAPAPSGSPTRLFTDWWGAEFLKVTGAKYAFEGAKDGAIVKKLLERCAGDLDDLKHRAMILLHAAPRWVDEGGKNLGTLLANYNRLVSQSTGQATGSKLLAAQERTHAMNGRETLPALPPSIIDTLPTTKVVRTV